MQLQYWSDPTLTATSAALQFHLQQRYSIRKVINSPHNGDKREKIRIDEVLIKYGSASGCGDEKWNQRISTAKLCSATQRRYRGTNDNFPRQTLRENFPGARTGSCCVGKSYIENFSSESSLSLPLPRYPAGLYRLKQIWHDPVPTGCTWSPSFFIRRCGDSIELLDERKTHARVHRNILIYLDRFQFISRYHQVLGIPKPLYLSWICS